MAYPSQAHELRRLLALARKLRELADDVLASEAGRELFPAAAAALEARANGMAAALPGARYCPAAGVHLHQPVNVLI